MSSSVQDIPVPTEKGVDYGKSCPDAGCFHDNVYYPSLAEAWEHCGMVPGCGFVMRHHTGNFYLRRLTDPDVFATDIWGYYYKTDRKLTVSFFCNSLSRPKLMVSLNTRGLGLDFILENIDRSWGLNKQIKSKFYEK